ncbi:hypothetical protein [Streptomyces sp. SLBN-118]|nr:hypothetical protein [Streptomyces sp. SLBN-118]
MRRGAVDLAAQVAATAAGTDPLEQRVTVLLSQMTIAEKATLL